VEYYTLLGTAAIVVGLSGFIPYLIDIMRGKTKPHAFSWFIWSLAPSVVFFAQTSRGGGAGAWIAAAQAVACLTVFVSALFRGEKEIVPLDMACMVVALFGVGLWAVMNNPLYAVVLITIVDAVGFVPTFRKSRKKPSEETLIMYALNALGFAISLFALQAISLTTVLYPASLVLTNFTFVIMVTTRRRSLMK
jgi:uncharacterized protein with PQ loop repeat